MKLGFVGLNSDVMFVLFESHGQWYQTKIPHNQIIWYMQHNFPWVMEKLRYYQLTDDYAIANWLYNFGDCPDGDTYIFDDLNPYHYCEFENATKVDKPKHITYGVCI